MVNWLIVDNDIINDGEWIFIAFDKFKIKLTLIKKTWISTVI